MVILSVSKENIELNVGNLYKCFVFFTFRNELLLYLLNVVLVQ